MRRNRQMGVTALGWLILLTPFAIVIYAGIRATPVYLNYLKVVKTLEGTKSDLKSGGATASSIKSRDRQALRDRHGELPRLEGLQDHPR